MTVCRSHEKDNTLNCSLLQILMSVLIMDHVPIIVSIQQEAIIASVLLDISFNPTTVTVKVSVRS